MNEKEFGKALLRFSAVAPDAGVNPRELARRIIERDTQRVRWLTWLTVLVWILASGPLFLMLINTIDKIPSAEEENQAIRRRVELMQRKDSDPKPPANIMDRVDVRLFNVEARARNANSIVLVVGFSVAALAIALFFTVLLLFVSRRATLRQVNANLMEISEQLKQLRHEPPT